MIHELFTPAIDFSSGLISTHFAEGVWEGGAAGPEVRHGLETIFHSRFYLIVKIIVGGTAEM